MLAVYRRKNKKLCNIFAVVLMVFAVSFVANGLTILNNVSALTYDIPDGYTTIVDPNFYDCVVTEFKKEYPSEEILTTGLTDQQLAKIKKLSCAETRKAEGEKISDTTGLEKMTTLEVLELNHNKITSIDVSNNTALKELVLRTNELASIDVSNNVALKKLDLVDNQIPEIDVSENTNLVDLKVSGNPIGEIDVSKNDKLVYLYANGCGLSDIDVSNNTKLKELLLGEYGYEYNFLTSLDVSKNTALELLNIDHNSFATIDLSHNTNLIEFNAAENLFETIDISKLTKLSILKMGWCELTSLDVSKNVALVDLGVQMNNLKSIDVSNNKKLQSLYIYSNKLNSIDVSKNTALTKLEIQNNLIDKLDVSQNSSLTVLVTYENQIKSIDITNNKKLTTFKADDILVFTGITPVEEDDTYLYDFSGLKFLTDGQHQSYYNYSSVTFSIGDEEGYIYNKANKILTVKRSMMENDFAQVIGYYDDGRVANGFSFKIALVKPSVPETDIPVPDTGEFTSDETTNVVTSLIIYNVMLFAIVSIIAIVVWCRIHRKKIHFC